MQDVGSSDGLSPRWRAVFRLEIPICLATVAYWLIAADDYLTRMFGPTSVAPSSRYLLWQGGATVGSLLVWFYGRVLFGREVHLPTFRLLQEGMALGDAGILALSAYLARAMPVNAGLLASQIAMATLWGSLRLVFLWQTREARGA